MKLSPSLAVQHGPFSTMCLDHDGIGFNVSVTKMGGLPCARSCLNKIFPPVPLTVPSWLDGMLFHVRPLHSMATSCSFPCDQSRFFFALEFATSALCKEPANNFHAKQASFAFSFAFKNPFQGPLSSIWRFWLFWVKIRIFYREHSVDSSIHRSSGKKNTPYKSGGLDTKRIQRSANKEITHKRIHGPAMMRSTLLVALLAVTVLPSSFAWWVHLPLVSLAQENLAKEAHVVLAGWEHRRCFQA